MNGLFERHLMLLASLRLFIHTTWHKHETYTMKMG